MMNAGCLRQGWLVSAVVLSGVLAVDAIRGHSSVRLWATLSRLESCAASWMRGSEQIAPRVHAGAPRIATPGISLASLVVALTGPQALAAVAPEVRHNLWLQRVFPAAEGWSTPFSSSNVANVEHLLKVDPSLVILWRSGKSAAERLRRLNLPVIEVSYSTPQEMIGATRVIADALGPAARQRAEALIAFYQRALAEVAAQVHSLQECDKPKVYYAGISLRHTEGQNSMVDAWISSAGGVNVAAAAGYQKNVEVSVEQVLSWDPDVVITLDAHERDLFLSDARWSTMKAVVMRRVYACPKGVNSWCTRAAEASLQVLWAAKVLHPRLFQSLEVGRSVRAFYAEFYGYVLNDSELQNVVNGLPPPPTRHPQ